MVLGWKSSYLELVLASSSFYLFIYFFSFIRMKIHSNRKRNAFCSPYRKSSLLEAHSVKNDVNSFLSEPLKNDHYEGYSTPIFFVQRAVIILRSVYIRHLRL